MDRSLAALMGTEPVPDEAYTLPLDEARVVREGDDVTVFA